MEIIITILRSVLLTFLSKDMIERVMFELLTWLVAHTETAYDDKLLEIVKSEYYKKIN